MSIKSLLDLSGRVALITGGSRGLGLQMAEALGEMGARAVITARRAQELDEARIHLEARGIEAMPLVTDLSDLESIPTLVDQVMQHFGQIDILLNNAGTTWGAPAETHPLDRWQSVVNLNLTSVFRLTQEVGTRSMLPRSYGRIVNIASIAGLVGNPRDIQRTLAYNASKGGVVSMTRALAAEWGIHGITVNAICPGFFHSKMADQLIERNLPKILESTPMNRIGSDDDLMGLAVLLASDASRHITGQAIAVDGGATAI
ncbi:MAG: SDR family oxidoreductase [Gammaproteobacteria bacterium]|nr:SDR family oxidoreductase [Gammaproteobacteria bacterium]